MTELRFDNDHSENATPELENAIALQNLGIQHAAIGNHDDAIICYRKALALVPHVKEAWYNLGIALMKKGEHQEAILCNQRAVELDPHFFEAHLNLAASNIELKNFDAVSAHSLKGIEIDPSRFNPYFNLGLACYEQGNLEGSLVFLERSAALNPDYMGAHCARSLVMLALGNLEQGWRGYEFRWHQESKAEPIRHFPYPWWQGESLADKTILVWGEQGIGDQMMFSSMLEQLIPLTKKCIFACTKKLIPLFKRSFPQAQIVDLEQANQLSDIDVQSPLGSTARWLRPTLAHFPNKPSFLTPDQDRVAYWKKRLADLGPELNVGICWRSGNISGDRAFYCTKIEQWEPIFAVPGVRFINLQYDECSSEIAMAKERFGVEVIAFPEVDLYDDIDETAALTKAVDLVISAPTTASILAGALGVPTWQMVSGFNWQSLGTSENCWYTTLKTIRRKWDQPWKNIMEDVATRLKNITADVVDTMDVALLHHQQGQLAQALALYEIVLQKDPDHAHALHLSGTIAYQNKQYDVAEKLMRRAIVINPSMPSYFCNLGALLNDLQRCDEAVEQYRLALALQPDYTDALLNLGSALFYLNQFDEAAELFRKTIQLQPNSAKAHDNLGLTLRNQHQYADAVKAFERALEIDPNYTRALTNLAATFIVLKNFPQASFYSLKAIEQDANNVDAYMYLGIACQEQGNLEASENFLTHAISLAPDNKNNHWNLSFTLLSSGKLEQGWREYEYRWVKETEPVKAQQFPYPWWQGETMPDKTILVWGEQGIGDEIAFASMLHDAIARFKHCIIACHKKLIPLYIRSFPTATIVDISDASSLIESNTTIDVQSAVGSLARWLRPTIESFPNRSHYLEADAKRVASWKSRIAKLKGDAKLTVGICWRTSDLTGNRLLYCTLLEQWGAIFSVPGIRFVSLQCDDCADELNQAMTSFGVQIHSFPEVDLFNDLDEAAALMKSLDLVISAPTSTAIMAAALGVPTWMMVAGNLWQKFGTDNLHWYTTSRVFSRRWDQPWEEVIADVSVNLAAI